MVDRTDPQTRATERQAAMYRWIKANYHAVQAATPGQPPACLFRGHPDIQASARSWAEIEAAIQAQIEAKS